MEAECFPVLARHDDTREVAELPKSQPHLFMVHRAGIIDVEELEKKVDLGFEVGGTRKVR